MGYTRTPCPACGKTDFRRKAGGICRACEFDRQELARIRAERAAATDGLIPVKYGVYPHWNGKIISHEARTFDSRSTRTDQLQQRLQEIADALVVPTDSVLPAALALFGAAQQYKYGYLRQDVAEALAAVYDLLQPLLTSVRNQARQEGLDLLGGLARGEITVRDFERRSQP